MEQYVNEVHGEPCTLYNICPEGVTVALRDRGQPTCLLQDVQFTTAVEKTLGFKQLYQFKG